MEAVAATAEAHHQRRYCQAEKVLVRRRSRLFACSPTASASTSLLASVSRPRTVREPVSPQFNSKSSLKTRVEKADKLAPFRFRLFGPYHPRPHPHSHPHPQTHHKQSLARFLFPRAVRDRYRERLLNFHLNTLPYLKHTFQSRVYRYILERQRRRAEQSRIVDIVRRQGRQLWLGSQASRPAKHARTRSKGAVAHKPPQTAGDMMGYGSSRASSPGDGERGYRRKRLAAMAGNLYRSGQAAVTEIKESYAQTRAGPAPAGHENHGRIHIPGAFPDVAITVKGDDQMVLFPSYAKQHIKRDWGEMEMHDSEAAHGSIKDEGFWRQEWERNEDEKAVVDVDVRGWIYTPHTGPMTRRNRVLIGLARQLSGIPAPRADQTYNPNTGLPRTHHQMHEEQREQEKIDQEARRIERVGQREKQVAYQGGFSEKSPNNEDPLTDSFYYPSRSGNQSPDSAPSSPTMPAKTYTNSSELSESDLVLANANLMARIAPFMTNPSVALPITFFFYNNDKSQSKTVMTNDAGHFIIRAALDFVPTHVRVLANEDLSAIQEIKVIEPYGVSLISDIDDTVKKSNISAGAKEIFRNTFIRDLSDLSVEGVKEWYNRMANMGVSIHYCSNSPWQLFPVLASFFKMHGLPPGSLHLKQYSGMLQGIFEPVAERKRSTLNRLLRDFPERSFILVGDSGEADLEVYTELALANPGRVLAVFIRDVTTPEEPAFFSSGFDFNRPKTSGAYYDSSRSVSRKPSSQSLAPSGFQGERRPSTGPAMGTLIDFSDEPAETKIDRSAALSQAQNSNTRSSSTTDLLGGRKPPPPRPAKPVALRSAKSITELNKGVDNVRLSRQNPDEPPPPPPRKPVAQNREPAAPHPLKQIHNSSQQSMASSNNGFKIPAQARDRVPSGSGSSGDRPPPPPPRRRGTPSNLPDPTQNFRIPPRRAQTTTNLDVDYDPLPSSINPPPSFGSAGSGYRSDGNASTGGSPTLGAQAVNKKLELWKRRLARAHEQLDGLGISLYTWRRGNDVIAEAEGIVKQALADMDRKRRTRR
ncbi:hypothetical protein F66182_1249 [Fusarium sp. NRRL 66182]|nr:hypothetical protein F66182_1249 [Fusarium sp. NRRL 66182]